MAKKSFQSAPKPKRTISPEEIDAFVNQGVGNDSLRKEATSSSKIKEKTKRLSIDLPQSMHLRFKTACSATQLKMTKEIESFISKRTIELEKEAGITLK